MSSYKNKRKFGEASQTLSIKVPESKFFEYKKLFYGIVEGKINIDNKEKENLIHTNISGNTKIIRINVPKELWKYYKKEFTYIIEHENKGETVEYVTSEFAEMENDEIEDNPNEIGNPELTKKDLKFFKTEILANMLETFDLLYDVDKLEDFIMLLSEKEKDKLYDHPILKEYDLLP